MKRSDLKIILEVLSLRAKDHPHLTGLYDELLDVYNKTEVQYSWNIPVIPQADPVSYLQIRRDE